MSEEILDAPPEASLDAAAERISEMRVPEPEAVEPEPVIEAPAEAPVDNLMQQQQQLVNYQNQLSQEQAAINAEEAEIKQLRQSDPAEFSARTMELMGKKEQHTYRVAQFENVVNQFDNQHTTRITKEHEQKIQQAKDYLERNIGNWDDNKAQQVFNYLRKKGMTDAQISQIPDAQTIESHYRAMKAQRPKTLPKKVKPVDRRAHAESEITRRHLGHNSIQAGAARIEALFSK